MKSVEIESSFSSSKVMKAPCTKVDKDTATVEYASTKSKNRVETKGRLLCRIKITAYTVD